MKIIFRKRPDGVHQAIATFKDGESVSEVRFAEIGRAFKGGWSIVYAAECRSMTDFEAPTLAAAQGEICKRAVSAIVGTPA